MTITAAMVRGALVAAAVTLLQVTAQGGSPAEFDGAHHAPLPARERICVFLPVRRTIAAKDIGHFEFGAFHRPALRNAEGQRASIQWPPAAGADRRGWWSNKPCWWRCGDSGPSWPSCDYPAGGGC